MLPTTLAIIDDEPRMTQILAMILGREGYAIDTYLAPRDFMDAQVTYDLVLTDLKMPSFSGVDILRHVKKQSPLTQVIIMTAHGTIDTALEAMKEGAFDYIQKPFQNDVVKSIIRRALAVTALQRENAHLRAQLKDTYKLDHIIAYNPAFQGVLQLAQRAAKSNATVLITGESGTGKEVMARTIHVHSHRVAGPFVAINCKALATGILESELFGHEKGAFTGASHARKGLFVQASGGTLFLDEVGELDLDVQAKLLRVLQEQVVRPVGANTTTAIDTRIVCATNRDLPKMVEAGTFREDLYYRLAVIPLHLPPLRQRPEDILPLARSMFIRLNEQLDRALLGWTPEVEHFLLNHDWPGNVRELENLMERAVVLAQREHIHLDDMLTAPPSSPASSTPLDFQADEPLQEFLDHATTLKIQHTLTHCQGKRAQAAALLGVERTTLYRMIKKLHIQHKNQTLEDETRKDV